MGRVEKHKSRESERQRHKGGESREAQSGESERQRHKGRESKRQAQR